MESITNYKEKELSNLTFMKVILIIIIVFYHSILAWGDNFEWLNVQTSSKFLFYLQQFTTTYHTRCFTIISGYLFFYLKHEKGKYQKFGPFTFNKFKRLIIPYLFVGLFFVAPIAYIAKEDTLENILKRLLLIQSIDQIWFLIMLFSEFIVFYLLDKFLEKHHLLSFLIGFSLLGIGYLLRNNGFKYLEIDATFLYFLFFLIGYKLRQLGSEKFYNINSIFYILYLLLTLTLFIIFKEVNYFVDKVYFSDILTAIMFITNGPIMFILFQKLSNKINYEKSKIYHFLKNKTFTIYLFHQQFIYLFIMLTRDSIKIAEINALIVFILTLISTLIITLIMHSNKVTKFLVGEKINN